MTSDLAYSSDSTRDVCDNYTVHGKDYRAYTDGSCKIIDAVQQQGDVSALLLSSDLALKIRKALCLG